MPVPVIHVEGLEIMSVEKVGNVPAGSVPYVAGAMPSTDQSLASHLRATALLAVPLIGAQLAQIAMNVADTVMVGWLGATQLAASVLGAQSFFLVFIFGSGFAQAAMPLAASAQGQGDIRGVRRSIRMASWVAILYAAIMMVPLWHTEAILVALGQDREVSALAGGYMRVVQWSLFPALFVMVLRSFLSVVDRAYVMLAIIMIGLVTNIALNWVLIFGNLGMPALGIVGAAVATLFSNVLMAAVLLAYVAKAAGLGRYEMIVRPWVPDWPAFAQILRLGWPIGATIIAEVGLFAFSSVMMGWLGTVPLAAHGIAVQLASIAFMVPLGLGSAATVRTGMAYGRADRTALKRAGHTALAMALIFGILAAAAFWVWPHRLIGFYLDPENLQSGEVLAYAVPLLFVAAAFQIVDGVQAVAVGLLRGIQDTRTPMVIALFSYWLVGMPAAYLLAFPLRLGGPGIWWGLAAGLATAAVLLTLRYLRRDRYLPVPAGTISA